MSYWWILAIILAALVIISIRKRYKVLKNMDMGASDSPSLVILNDSDYKKQISTGITLIDFWAPWCMPCKIQGPIVSEVADLMVDKASICKLNIDENKRAAAEFGVRSIPTIIIFKDGKIVDKLVGVKSKSVLVKSLKTAMSK